MTAGTEGLRTNADRLLTVRALGVVAPPVRPGPLPEPEGTSRFRPGQGSVALNVGLGNRAAGWASDHLEPGASLYHPVPSANRALQVLSCVGNPAVVTGGAAAGRRGIVIGKHGMTLVAFAPAALALLAPGDPVCIDTRGVGLAIPELSDVQVHSVSPDLLERIATVREGRLHVRATAILPARVAAAGLGMEAAWANIDLETHDDGFAAEEGLDDLRFGDLVILPGADHRYARRHDPEWVTLGVIAHGVSVAGGHGLGMTTLLTAPARVLHVEIDPEANVGTILGVEERWR